MQINTVPFINHDIIKFNIRVEYPFEKIYELSRLLNIEN